MSYLYIVDDSAVMNVNGGYFIVTYKDSSVHKIPSETLESVSLFGNIQITTQCMKKLLEMGIPVSFFSKNGSYFGKLESTRHVNVFRLKKQLALTEDKDFSSKLAQRIITAKINNQTVLLRRYARHKNININDEIFYMNDCKKKIAGCIERDEIMGYEGTAAKHYFKGLAKVIEPSFSFKGRNRMPPRDPFNSMLSLGYTIMMYEIYGEIENKGLSPYGGFIHADRERHPTLASDLMEEWRAVIVDSVVMSLCNGKEISCDEFVTDEETGGIFLTKAGMRIFLKKLEEKLRGETGYLESTYRMSYRGAFRHQVNVLVQAIEESDPYLYEPIVIR